MNYMRELNAFRDWKMINRPSTGVIALWYMLMSINNMTGWKEWFTAPNQTVQLLTGLSRQGGESTRNSLIQYGLIEYKKGKSNQAGSYRMISLLEDKKSDLPVDNFSECKNLGTVGGTPVAHSYTRLDVNETININHSAREASSVDKLEIDSVCPTCKGQGWYLTQVPFNNGVSMWDEALLAVVGRSLHGQWEENMNKVIIVGRLTRDPEVGYTQAGKAVTTFSVAVDTGFGENKRTGLCTCYFLGKTGINMW